MQKTQTQNDQVTELHRLVNDLAMQFVMGSSSESLAGLDEIVRIAGAAGMTTMAEDGVRLKKRLAALAPDSAEFSDAAQTGIQILQETLEARQAAAEVRPAPAAPVSMAQDPELINDFIVESREHLQAIEQHVLVLEQDPSAADPIHAIFRAFHTIKGIAGFLEFQDIRDVSHETETLLDQARNGNLEAGPQVIDVILEAADYLTREINRIEAGGTELPASTGRLLNKLRDALAGPSKDADGNIVALSRAVEESNEPPKTTKSSKKAVVTSSIKVDTAKLDFLVDMVGEMVIAQSLVRHSPDLANVQSQALLRNVAQLSRITGEVQKTAMSMRMVPIGMLFQKMARLIRDTSRKAGKQAELVTVGEDTELDRNIVEELADPLMHMVRNAIDHGIEPPKERIAAGKPATAKIELRAAHQGGHILIEIADDGRGMNRDAILKKAVERGIVSATTTLPDVDIYNLIFEPGFSTAEKVTDISGRGVGMDVVKRHIQKLRGRTEIQTVLGKGTTFQLKLPLTLAIIDGLIVGVGGERYIVPIFTVKELLRPTEGMVTTVEGRREIALVRERVLPVVRLYRRFGVTPRTKDPLESLLIITESQGAEYCLMVDALLGKQEVVIKSLGEAFRNVTGIAGGAILGDGRVGLILEMNALFNSSRHR